MMTDTRDDGSILDWYSIRRLIQDSNDAYKRFIFKTTVITTVSTLKIFSPFRINEGFPLKRLSRDIILVYQKN